MNNEYKTFIAYIILHYKLFQNCLKGETCNFIAPDKAKCKFNDNDIKKIKKCGRKTQPMRGKNLKIYLDKTAP